MEVIFEQVQGLLLFTAALLVLGLLASKALQGRVDFPGRTIGKWVLTGVAGYSYAFILKPMSGEGGAAALIAVLLAVVVGLILAIMWAPPFLDFMTRPIMDLFTGGWFADEKRPFYALAKGRRKRGEFSAAIEEIDKQVSMFPESVEGWLLKAEIQAEDMGDVAAAADTIDELVENEESNAEVASVALTKLADWQLRLAGDPEGADAALQRLIGLFPETETATRARQLVNQLPDRARLKANPGLRDALQPKKGAKRIRVTTKARAQSDIVVSQDSAAIRIVESDRSEG